MSHHVKRDLNSDLGTTDDPPVEISSIVPGSIFEDDFSSSSTLPPPSSSVGEGDTPPPSKGGGLVNHTEIEVNSTIQTLLIALGITVGALFLLGVVATYFISHKNKKAELKKLKALDLGGEGTQGEGARGDGHDGGCDEKHAGGSLGQPSGHDAEKMKGLRLGTSSEKTAGSAKQPQSVSPGTPPSHSKPTGRARSGSLIGAVGKGGAGSTGVQGGVHHGTASEGSPRDAAGLRGNNAQNSFIDVAHVYARRQSTPGLYPPPPPPAPLRYSASDSSGILIHPPGPLVDGYHHQHHHHHALQYQQQGYQQHRPHQNPNLQIGIPMPPSQLASSFGPLSPSPTGPGYDPFATPPLSAGSNPSMLLDPFRTNNNSQASLNLLVSQEELDEDYRQGDRMDMSYAATAVVEGSSQAYSDLPPGSSKDARFSVHGVPGAPSFAFPASANAAVLPMGTVSKGSLGGVMPRVNTSVASSSFRHTIMYTPVTHPAASASIPASVAILESSSPTTESPSEISYQPPSAASSSTFHPNNNSISISDRLKERRGSAFSTSSRHQHQHSKDKFDMAAAAAAATAAAQAATAKALVNEGNAWYRKRASVIIPVESTAHVRLWNEDGEPTPSSSPQLKSLLLGRARRGSLASTLSSSSAAVASPVAVIPSTLSTSLRNSRALFGEIHSTTNTVTSTTTSVISSPAKVSSPRNELPADTEEGEKEKEEELSRVGRMTGRNILTDDTVPHPMTTHPPKSPSIRVVIDPPRTSSQDISSKEDPNTISSSSSSSNMTKSPTTPRNGAAVFEGIHIHPSSSSVSSSPRSSSPAPSFHRSSSGSPSQSAIQIDASTPTSPSSSSLLPYNNKEQRTSPRRHRSVGEAEEQDEDARQEGGNENMYQENPVVRLRSPHSRAVREQAEGEEDDGQQQQQQQQMSVPRTRNHRHSYLDDYRDQQKQQQQNRHSVAGW